MNWYKKKTKDKKLKEDKELEKDFMSISQYGQDAVNVGGNVRDSNDETRS